jgi:HEAT repeat protein
MMPLSSPRPLVLIILLLGCSILAFYVGVILRISIVYTHLFYVPIILGGLWYPRKAILPALYLGLLHLGVEYAGSGGLEFSMLARVGIFLLVAVLVGLVAGRIQRQDRVSLQYLSSYAERVSTPRTRIASTFDGIRMSLGMNLDVEKMRERGDLRGLLRTLDHSRPEIRYQAVDALGTLRDPAAGESLARALRDTDCGVRWKAAEALGKMGEQALPFLLDALHDSSADVRWRAALALGASGERSVIPVLIQTFADPDRYVGGRSIITVAGFGAAALPLLTEAAEDPDVQIQSGAIRALGLLGEPGLEVILQMLGRGPVREILAPLEEAFFDVGSASILPLLDLLQHSEDPGIRSLACRVLGRLEVVESLPVLTLTRDRDESEKVRHEAGIVVAFLSDLKKRHPHKFNISTA